MPMPPRDYVAGPVFTPLPFGLLSALSTEIRTPASPHWQHGVTYETLCALGATTYDECFAVSGTGSAAPAPPPAKSATTNLDIRGATAFTVMAEVDCGVPGFWDRADELGAQALAQSEQYQVERAFWTGLAGGAEVVFPHLAADAEVLDESGALLQTAATTILAGATLDVVEALGRLELALSDCYNGVGVIHAPRSLASTLVQAGQLIREGSRYRTANGHLVVLGAGYPGTSPAGAASNALAWMYATGAMFIYRSAVDVRTPRDSINRENNSVLAIAERKYLVAWDCCHIGTNVTLGGVPAGASGGIGPAV